MFDRSLDGRTVLKINEIVTEIGVDGLLLSNSEILAAIGQSFSS